MRDVTAFLSYLGENIIDKELVVEYKRNLEEEHFQTSSINSMLASLNSFLAFSGHAECKVKMLKVQRKIYEEEKELTKDDYMKLLEASKNEKQLNLIFQTICSTGIRVSELKYFTVEGIKKKKFCVQCKNKIRTIFVPNKLRTHADKLCKGKGYPVWMHFCNKKRKSLRPK